MAASLSERLKSRNAWAANTPFNYGWVIVGVAALSMFMDSFVDEFGWNRTYVSSIYAAATLAAGLLMFFVGRIVDRSGARWVAIAAAAILGIACVILSTVISPVMLFGGFFLARFAGKGALDLSASTLAPQWFIKRRAFSIMLVGLGGTAGGVVFPLLNAYLINTYGWRQAFQFLAIGLWIIYIPIAFFFMINRPEDVGMSPDGNVAPPADGTTQADAKATAVIDEVSFTQAQAVRTSAFWIITFCVFQASMVGTGIILHFISIFGELGFDMAFAAKMMSIKPLIGLGTVILAGLTLDRIKHQNYVLALACFGQVAGYVLLVLIRDPLTAFLYALVTGVSAGLLGLSLGVLKPNLFGRRYLGGILGVMAAINVVGSAIGPIVFGAAFDAVGGYREVILLSALLPLFAGILSLMLRKPQLPEQVGT
jgi:MFS family permease